MDSKNKIEIVANVDSSGFDQKISELQRKLKSLRETGPSGTYAQLAQTYRSQGNEQAAQRTEQYRENVNKQLRTQLARDLQQQESLLNKNESAQKRVRDSLENTLKTQQNINKAKELEISLAERHLKISENISNINKAMIATGGGAGGGGDIPLGPRGPGGTGRGMFGALADPKILAAIGSAIGFGGEAYRKIARYPETIAQREATIAGMTSETARLQAQGKGYEMSLFAPERAKALQRASAAVGAEKFGDITKIAAGGIAGYMGGRVIGAGLGTWIGGGIGSLFGGAGAIPGAAIGNWAGGYLGGMAGAAVGSLYDNRRRSMLLDPNAYQKEMGAVFSETYQQQLAAERAKSYEKDFAAQFFERESGRFRGLQRGFGLSDEELFRGDQSIFRRAARAGYDMDTITQAMQGISAGGGPTSVVRGGGQIAAQLQRNLDLTNAPQLLGRISGVTGKNEIQSKDEIIRMYAEATRIGLDTSEIRDYMQTAADIGYKTGGNLETISNLLSAGVEGTGLKSTRGIEAAQTALERVRQQTSEMGGLTGQYQIAELSGKDITEALGGKGLSAEELSYVGATDITKIDDKYLSYLLRKRGQKADSAQIENLRKRITTGKTKSTIWRKPEEDLYKELQDPNITAQRREDIEQELKGFKSIKSGDFAKLGLKEQEAEIGITAEAYGGKTSKITEEEKARIAKEVEKPTTGRMADLAETSKAAGDLAGSLYNLNKQAQNLINSFEKNAQMGEAAAGAAANLRNLSTILENIKDSGIREDIQKQLIQLHGQKPTDTPVVNTKKPGPPQQ